jgi:hypothetical protein
LIEIGPMPPRGRQAAAADPSPRLTERHVLALGLASSAAFVLAAAIFGAWTIASGGSAWSTLHLALAGAAMVAIGAFMPHFAVTLAGTRPALSVARLMTIAALTLGGALAVAGMTILGPSMAVVGTLLTLLGLAGVAVHTLAPLRDPLARRHTVVTAAYGLALFELAVGVALGGAVAAGSTLVVSEWATLRPAHAWVTLFGGVSLTITATLVYLVPTVLGARIRPSPALVAAVAGIGLGPPLTAVGFVLDERAAVLLGVGICLLGALGQLVYIVDCHRRRGRFTSEHDWRAVVTGHLLAGPAWFAAAVAVTLAELVAGRAVSGWSIGLLALPLIAGWMLQELVGSWTHLAPSVTPGDPVTHARQRRILAALSRTRLVAWNVGLAALWAGLAAGVPALSVPGGVALAVLIGASVILLARALTVGRYWRHSDRMVG